MTDQQVLIRNMKWKSEKIHLFCSFYCFSIIRLIVDDNSFSSNPGFHLCKFKFGSIGLWAMSLYPSAGLQWIGENPLRNFAGRVSFRQQKHQQTRRRFLRPFSTSSKSLHLTTSTSRHASLTTIKSAEVTTIYLNHSPLLHSSQNHGAPPTSP